MDDLFNKKVSDATRNDMVREILNEEIKAAMFDIGEDRAAGPNRFMFAFLKRGEILLAKSKIITNWIIDGTKEFVSENQSAFVPGMQIFDNILITQELMHNYHSNRGPPRCAFKVDIQKAYDIVDWRFLDSILKGFGFHPTMVKWIMACVTSTSFSVSLNGNVHGFFKGKRGLRQSDPLSRYLFTLDMGILTLILKRRMIFLFFSRGEVDSAHVIMKSLDEFKKSSGLVPSIPTSTTYFCNVRNHVKISILNIMPFVEGQLLVKYLGVPLISLRLLNKDCEILVEEVKNKIGDWKIKSLSFVGRLQLCKSVISSMKVYWAYVLIIPKDPITESQEMSTPNTHQQSLADTGSEIRHSMLERVCLAKRLTKDSYDDLFDYLQQFEKLVNASRANQLEKSHDPLALVAHTSSSSRTTTPYYVTYPSSVVDYDDDYQGDAIQNNFEDPLTSSMILLACAITQQEIIEGNNVQNDSGNIQRTLQTTSSGTATIVQCYNFSEKGHYARNCPNPRVQDSKYIMEQMLLAKQDEAVVSLTDEQNDFLFADASWMEEIEELSVNICLMARIQPANFDFDKGPSYDSAFLNEVQGPSTSYVNPLFAKDAYEQKYSKLLKIINNTIGDDQIDSNIIFDEPNEDVCSGSVEYDNNV
nr:hypothetical protein [Tanacetum cinerariifolium]